MGPGGTAVPCAVVEYSPEERVLNSERCAEMCLSFES